MKLNLGETPFPPRKSTNIRLNYCRSRINLLLGPIKVSSVCKTALLQTPAKIFRPAAPQYSAIGKHICVQYRNFTSKKTIVYNAFK